MVRFATLSLGAASLWAQVLIVRFGLVAFGGNELVVALLFGFWLVAVGCGALAGGAAVRWFRSLAPFFLAVLFLLFALSIYSEYFVARGLRAVVGLPAGECPALWQVAAGIALITVPVSFLVGLLFPLLAEARFALGRGSGEVYALEAAGSLAAAAAGTYYFLARGRDDLLVFWAVVLLVMAAALFFHFQNKVGAKAAKLAWLLFVVWFFAGGYSLEQLKVWGNDLRWYGLEGFTLLKERETPYGNAALLSRKKQYQLFLDGQFVFSFPDHVEEETRAHVAASQALSFEKVVLFGGRPGLVRELCKYKPTRLHVVQLDQALREFVEAYMEEATRNAFERQEVLVHTADPRTFLRSQDDGSCTLVLLELPEPSSAGLNRFYTVEFFREVKRVLAASGVFSFSIEAGLHLKDDAARYAGKFLAALQKEFPHIVMSAGSGIRFFAAAGSDVVTADPGVLMKRFEARGIETDHFKRFYFVATDAFDEEKVAFTKKRVSEAAGSVRPDHDAMPKLFIHHLIMSARKAGSPLASGLRAMLSLSLWQVLPWALLPGVLVFLLRKRNTVPLVLTVGSTGLWGMSLQVLVLFMFQTQVGVLYYKIGMLTGSFMFGLSMGAFRGCRVRRYRRTFLLLEALAVLVAGLTIGVSFLLPVLAGMPVELVFYLWAACIGFITGSEFSVANIVITARNRTVDHTGIIASLTDGADHLGASLGALTAGLLLLPALGLYGSILFLAFLKTATCIALWSDSR